MTDDIANLTLRLLRDQLEILTMAFDRQRRADVVECIEARIEKDKEAMAALEIVKDAAIKAVDEKKAGHHDKAFELAQQSLEAAEAWETKNEGKAGKFTAGALNSVAFYGLFVCKYDTALAAASRSINLDPGSLQPVTNCAHALMFLGHTSEAKTAYLAHRGEKMDQRDWNYYIADDFKQLRAAGLSHAFMNDIELELGLQAAAVATPEAKATP